MNVSEAAALLAVAAAFDNRKPDADAAQAWAIALDELSFIDCRDAIVKHYRESRDWLMPSDVIRRVREVRRARLQAIAHVQPPLAIAAIKNEHEFDLAYRAWLSDTRQRAAAGELIEEEPREIVAGNVHEIVKQIEQKRERD